MYKGIILQITFLSSNFLFYFMIPICKIYSKHHDTQEDTYHVVAISLIVVLLTAWIFSNDHFAFFPLL